MTGTDGSQRSVRIEIDGGSGADRAPTPTVESGDRRALGGAGALFAGLAIVFGGLWWLSSSATEVDESPPTTVAQPAPGTDADDDPEEPSQDASAVAADDVTDGALRDPAFETPIPLQVFPSFVAGDADRLVLAGSWLAGPAEIFRQAPVARSDDAGQSWNFGGTDFLVPGDRVVGLQTIATPEGSSDLRIFISSLSVDPDSPDLTTLKVYRPTDLAQTPWALEASFPVRGHVRSVSTMGDDWAAIVDRRAQTDSSAPPMQTQLLSGTIDGGRLDFLEVAPDEFVSSFAAVDGGFLAVVTRLQLTGLSSSPTPPALRRWKDGAWETIVERLEIPESWPPARIIDSGEQPLLGVGPLLYAVDLQQPAEVWAPVAAGGGVTASLGAGLAPSASPAAVGEGYLIVDNIVGEVETAWISPDGSAWYRAELGPDVRGLQLLRMDELTAVFTADIGGEPSILRLTRGIETPPRAIDVQTNAVSDGEWTQPVLSAASLDGPGFVGLTNTNGQVALQRSRDAFLVDESTQTDFPFGYFTNDLEVTEAGYHVVGQLGLFEDAVFVSDDGTSWERLAVERPNEATALQIDAFHRSASAAALTGTLGWADDLSRTERTVLWFDQDGRQFDVPPRPCDGIDGTDTVACTIRGLVALPDGILASHQVGGRWALSRWDQATNEWGSRLFDNEIVPRSAGTSTAPLIVAPSSERIALLGLGALYASSDGGGTWEELTRAPDEAVLGAFEAVSATFETSLYRGARSDLWLWSSGTWSRWSATGSSVGTVLAINDEAVVLAATTDRGPATARIATDLLQLRAPEVPGN